MNKPVKVSIVVPIYNVERYLSTCLNSCTNQTLYDIEILCINDGSTDNSLKIAQEFEKKDNRVKVITKENGGLSSARNAGIKAALGQIVMFLDSDDYLAENACERVWCEFLEAPTDIVTFGTNIFPLKPEPTSWHRNVLTIKTRKFTEFSPDVLFGDTGAKPFVWRQAFSKELLDKSAVLFDETVKYGEDMVFQLQIFPHAKNFSFISDRLYFYRWYREGSLMSSLRDDIDARISSHFEFVEIIADYWEKQGWLDFYAKDFLQWLLSFLVPDIKNKSVQVENEHLEKLNGVLTKYNLKKHFSKVNSDYYGFVELLPRKIRKH